jgi:hypothetical protein
MYKWNALKTDVLNLREGPFPRQFRKIEANEFFL